MSKNIERVPRPPVMRIPVEGAPRLRGWAVRYISGLEDPAIKPGFWLSHWQASPTKPTATFNFEYELVMCFGDEAEAKAVSDALRVNGEVETEVVRVD